MTGALRLVLGDQLTPGVAALRGLDRAGDVVLMAEVDAEATYVRHHKKKIALTFAAMRRFAERLRATGVAVRYVRIDDPHNAHSIEGEARRALQETGLARLIATRCGEWRLDRIMQQWPARLPAAIELREDDRFVCAIAEFRAWAQARKQPRMEFFYRWMRTRTGLLMEGDAPVGGRWNFDAENRAKPPRGLAAPPRRFETPDALTRAAIADVAARYSGHFGDLEPWIHATSPEAAEAQLEAFLDHALPSFGAYQDAMISGEPFLWHGLISTSLNLGLLDPLDVCRRAEARWRAGAAPLNAVEGFIRQIIGWREYVRGLYWTFMPDYAETNALAAQGALPDFYWTGETDMACLREAISATRRYAYAHHIQRLMLTGNFALLAGVAPAAVNEWYMIVYADAYEWVELPNTHGMALYADGGLLASKPYAASGAYVNRMSDHCRACRYDVKTATAPTSCPFNALYWDFLMRNAERLETNPRMGIVFNALARKPAQERAALAARAAALRAEFGVDRAGETA